jgi:alanine dehydrogenase
MSEQEKRIPIPKELTEGQIHTQTETLQRSKRPDRLFIGIPREIVPEENRVALIPSSVSNLVNHGHRIVVEAGAGEKAYYPDHDYAEAGAEIVYSPEEVYKADVMLKVAPPSIQEIELMRAGQLLISPLQLPTISAAYIQGLKDKKVIALAMEYIKDDSGNFPVVRIMSELAGSNAIVTAAELLTKNNGGRGVLLGGISGVPSAKVVILGAGIVAEYATRAAIGLGADVRIFDDNIYKLKRIQNQVGRPLNTSALNTVYLERQLVTADVVIGAMHSKTGRTPLIVSEDTVMKMKPGSVIIDVSIDQGGCFATSEVTSLDRPTFIKHDIIHYCVPNIASKVSRTASIAISNILTTMLLKTANPNLESMVTEDYGLRHGIYLYKGWLTNEYLGQRFGIKSTDLDLIVTSYL